MDNVLMNYKVHGYRFRHITYTLWTMVFLINVFPSIDKYGLTRRVVDKLLYELGGRVLRVPMADGRACT
jgi:hypothetical protein